MEIQAENDLHGLRETKLCDANVATSQGDGKNFTAGLRLCQKELSYPSRSGDDFFSRRASPHMIPNFSFVRRNAAVCCVIAFSGILYAAPVKLHDEAPVEVRQAEQGVIFVDFGKVAFGNVRLLPPAGARGKVVVHFGEALEGQRINRKPPGSVRYSSAEVELVGAKAIVAAPPADKRNTTLPKAVLTPPEWGVVLPFRWVEIEGWSGPFKPEQIVRQAGYSATWDDQAAAFKSSDEMLNRIWELCRYSIKATTFSGIYVDGDRERIPYEADAYINQLAHYATDHDLQISRDTFDRLMTYPTWPTEWAPHMVFIAHADWLHSGDAKWLEPRYESLKTKLLTERADADGWIRSNKKQQGKDDIVDWPAKERDGYVFREVNTVVNAFRLAALAKMADLAKALGKTGEAGDFSKRHAEGRERFHKALFMQDKGAYRDGIGTDHASSHASLFPLAFGLVPEDHRAAVVAYLVKRGMTCSVYAAQYLLEGLFAYGADQAALKLITASGDRSWRHMVESGTTITWEAWDMRYKPNQDWNHAWGAAPASLLPRFVLGAEPVSAGWKTTRIRPHPGGLSHSNGKVPTPLGPINIAWTHKDSFDLQLDLPAGIKATIELPAAEKSSSVLMDGRPVPATRKGDRLVLDQLVEGSMKFKVR
jgi:alpha-L-rhamnosidase